MAGSVFISHCKEDADTASRICALLGRDGVGCWIAPRDIPPGQEWPQAIADAIGNARVMVILLSSHTEASRQIGRELELADTARLVIISVRIEDVPPPQRLRYFLGNLQWIDAFGSHFEAGMNQLLGSVRASMQLPPTLQQPFKARVRPSGPKKRGIWIAIGAGVVALGLAGYFFNSQTGPNPQPVPNPQPLPNVPGPQPTPKPQPVVDPPVNPSPPVRRSVAGVWQGVYSCAGIVNQVRLTIDKPGESALTALLQFAIPGLPAAPPGAYWMRGTISADGHIRMNFVKWQYVPPGFWQPENFEGQANIDQGVIEGRVLDPSCAGFSVRRQ